jgi:hypothetical protein
MAAVWAIAASYAAILVGFIFRFVKDDKDGCRDGFDDSKEVR